MYAPICLFTYNRLSETRQTVEALQKNYLAAESDLIVFSDGAKDEVGKEKVQSVRDFLRTIKGFRSVKVIESPINKGLADSIIIGVTKIVNEYGSVIVLEDDLQTSVNFISYMNQALQFYKDNASVISISGYNMKVKRPREYHYDNYFALRSASWGWATWAHKWNGIDWCVSDFKEFCISKANIRRFNKMGSDMFKMLKDQQQGKNNSWAIRYCYHQFKYGLYSVYPIISKVRNIGFGGSATHTVQSYNRFDVQLDTSGQFEFEFSSHVLFNDAIIRQFARINGVRARIYSRIANILGLK